MARFGEVLTAMATPFKDDLSLDLDGACALARWLAENGSEGLVIAGTTGEAPTLTVQEHLDLARAVREAVTIPVIVGTGSNDTAHAIEMTKAAEDLGADAVLVVTPYYNRPSQAGLDAHFRAVAASTALPVVLYDIPVRTGRPISNEVLLGLARDVPNVVAVKDASGDLAQAAVRVASAPPGFEVYSGDDNLTLAFVALGAVGAISVASHWAGSMIGEMIRCHKKGDVEGARDLNALLLDSYAFETGDLAPNPVPTKCMLRVLGLPGGSCRLPMGPEPDDLEQRARKVYEQLRG
jgi:4-hydroxy-tetrahydrodipicolinate synthase